jgi:cardiolipin synthase
VSKVSLCRTMSGIALFFTLTHALGCASPPRDPGTIKELPPETLTQAYLGEREVLFEYQVRGENFDAPFYVQGYWAPSDYEAEDTFDDIRAELVPMAADQARKWKKNGRTTRVLPDSLWLELLTEFFHLAAPENPGDGVLVEIQDSEVFVSRAPNGEFLFHRLQDKPSNVRLVGTVDREASDSNANAALENFLSRHPDLQPPLLFSTGEAQEGRTAFVLIDIQAQETVFFDFPLVSQLPAHSGTASKGFHSFSKLIVAGQFSALVKQPVTTVHRFFSGLRTRSYDLVKFSKTLPDRNQPIPPLAQGPGMDLETWEKDLDRIARDKQTEGTIRFLIDGIEFFPALIDEVSRADESVELRTFIFDNDDYALTIAAVLKQRSHEISVKVLMDQIGSKMVTVWAAEPAPSVRSLDRPRNMEQYLREDSQVKARSTRNPWLTADHTKTTTIDHDLGFIGGMNIGEHYRYDWHDVMMEVQGPVVAEFRREFSKAWDRAGSWGDWAIFAHSFQNKTKPVVEGAIPLRTLYTKTGDSQIYRAQIQAIKRSKKRIFVETPYFSDDELLAELVHARRRGVDVRVILPGEGNHGLMNGANHYVAYQLLEYGVRVYAYPGMSHVKAAVYDGWACLGSANFDRLSLRSNQEANLATSDPETVQRLVDRLFLPDFENSREISELPEVGWSTYFSKVVANQL